MINSKPLILVFLSFLSCNKKKDLTIILSTINRKDSTMVLEIQNNTEKNLVIEFPKIDNFLYEDESKNIAPENFKPIALINMKVDSTDFKKFIALKCSNLMIDNLSLNNNAKFLEAKSKRRYYYKLEGYKKGRVLLMQDLGVNKFADKKTVQKLKFRNCSGYQYFTGSFEFIPRKIILP